MRKVLTVFIIFFATATSAQELGKLTVEKIMRDPKWMGSSPSAPFWSQDGNTLYFSWNPDKAASDSIYFITKDNKTPQKASVAQKQNIISNNAVVYNVSRTAFVYAKDGDIFYTDARSGKTKRITQTVDAESNPSFCFSETKIVYSRAQNLFAWDIAAGETMQLSNIQKGTEPPKPPVKENLNAQEQWLKNDQLQNFDVLRSRKEKRETGEAYTKAATKKELRGIYIEDKNLNGLLISPDGRFISYRLSKPATNAKNTIVPSYVTESGFTTDIPGRTKVGAPLGSSESFIYDRERDTVLLINTDSLPGINDKPDYVKYYPVKEDPKKDSAAKKMDKKKTTRPVSIGNIDWSPKGAHAVVEIRSQDNKDRWLMELDTAGKLKPVDRQRDEAWISGPGIGFGNSGWIDEHTYWFQSEVTGYSHLYTYDFNTKMRKALTSGNYEIQQVQLSNDKKYFYINTNQVHPGDQQFYKLAIANGKTERITTMTGSNQVSISPDEKTIAVLYSFINKPWELYLQENKVGGKIEQLTNKAQSDEFKSYAWKVPEVISFTARDGATVYARVYKPANPDPKKPAVLFVHGAGYLQNAHKWWSSYFREYMFNNMLSDNGYYVMDVDYRGSAGYGRDVRTGIYRWMGGKDLDDNVDAVNYMVKNFGVDPKRVGLYGGSYGGFITLMGLFTTDAFAAGAALRPVTDWANYNHGYTSNILNEPTTDSIAYRKSSPYYFADGLKGHLLICHGMVDVNVNFQDAVKLSQRLIELGKDNWEIAPYPMEDHGFVEPSSWRDEYKRIFKLFETELKK